MQFQVLLESFHAQESQLVRSSHLGEILESKMVAHQFRHPFCVPRRQPKPQADLFCYLGADFAVSVETNSFTYRKSGRLSHVVQEYAHGQRRAGGTQLLEHQKGMNPYVSFRVKLGRLLDALHGLNFRQNSVEQTGFVEELKSPARLTLGKDS